MQRCAAQTVRRLGSWRFVFRSGSSSVRMRLLVWVLLVMVSGDQGLDTAKELDANNDLLADVRKQSLSRTSSPDQVPASSSQRSSSRRRSRDRARKRSRSNALQLNRTERKHDPPFRGSRVDVETGKPMQAAAAAKCYAERYPDLRASFCNTPKANLQSGSLSCSWRKLLQHYVSQGVQEKRQWGCSGNREVPPQCEARLTTPPAPPRDVNCDCQTVLRGECFGNSDCSGGLPLCSQEGSSDCRADNTVEVVVPSPARWSVLDATSTSSFAPTLARKSSSSMSRAMVTPSLTTSGTP